MKKADIVFACAVGFGLISKMLVWGILGMGINMAMIIFSSGTPAFLEYMGLTGATEFLAGPMCWQKVLWPLISFAAAACLAACIYVPIDAAKQNYMTCGNSVILAHVVQPSRGGADFDAIVEAIDSGRYEDAYALIADIRSAPAPEYDLSSKDVRDYQEAQYQHEMQTLDYLEAVALMRQGKFLKARRALKALAADDSSNYQDDAQELLDKL